MSTPKGTLPPNRISYAEGDKIGLFCTYVSEAPSLPKKRKIVARCLCGNNFIVDVKKLRHGSVKSCGCYMKTPVNCSAYKHGMTGSTEYKSWSHMKARCLDPNNHKYRDYGGRGITVCKWWADSFENFYASMGPKPGKGYTIERINNNGNYVPSNCRWATPKEQSNNRRTSAFLTFEAETLTIAQWSDKTGICQGVIGSRRKLGWDTNSILTIPVRK